MPFGSICMAITLSHDVEHNLMSHALQKRLLIGLGFTAAAVALALIPTADLRGKPSKPLFFYLTPLVRIQVCGCLCSSSCACDFS